MKASVREYAAMEALAKACASPVQFACCALVSFHGDAEDVPLPRYSTSFQQGDYIHFKQQYNDDWWIGRVVGHNPMTVSGMGFIPSEARLCATIVEMMESEQKLAEGTLTVYEGAPIMRPVVFVGPSLKSSQLTELLQKALVSFMKEQFAGRLVTIKPEYSMATVTQEEEREVESLVYQAGTSLNLVFLDSDASFPSDLCPSLHPLIVYIQISRQKVLHKLVKEMSANSRERAAQLDAAYQLYENPHHYSLIISDSNHDDACQNLELFLESYWAATRSVITVETSQQPSPRPQTTPPVTETQL